MAIRTFALGHKLGQNIWYLQKRWYWSHHRVAHHSSQQHICTPCMRETVEAIELEPIRDLHFLNTPAFSHWITRGTFSITLNTFSVSLQLFWFLWPSGTFSMPSALSKSPISPPFPITTPWDQFFGWQVLYIFYQLGPLLALWGLSYVQLEYSGIVA